MANEPKKPSNEAQHELGSDRQRTPPASDRPVDDPAGEAERGASANEGEGSRTADRRYREGVAGTVRRGHVEEDAERAAREVAADPEPYREAEREGRSHSAGEAPGDEER